MGSEYKLLWLEASNPRHMEKDRTRVVRRNDRVPPSLSRRGYNVYSASQDEGVTIRVRNTSPNCVDIGTTVPYESYGKIEKLLANTIDVN